MGACERPTKADQAPPGSKESPNVSSWPMQQFYSAEEMSVQAKLPEGRVIDRTQSSQPAEGHPIEMPATSPDEYGVARHHNDSRCALCCPHDSSFAAAICCISMLPLPCWLGACTDVKYREEAAVYLCDQPYAHVSGHRWLCVNPCLRVETYSSLDTMVNLDEVKAADADGSPIVLSGIVTYRVHDPWKAFAASGIASWVQNKGLIVMKEVASRFPYDASPGEHSLRTRASRDVVVSCLKKEMQRRCDTMGLHISSFEFTDMHYAPEVAAQMLVTQQAKATLNARRIIVEGAVGIVAETVQRLEQQHIAFTSQQKADLVRSLLVMSVSDAPAQTTVPV